MFRKRENLYKRKAIRALLFTKEKTEDNRPKETLYPYTEQQ